MQITPDMEEFYEAFDKMVDRIVERTTSLPRLETLLFQGKSQHFSGPFSSCVAIRTMKAMRFHQLL